MTRASRIAVLSCICLATLALCAAWCEDTLPQAEWKLLFVRGGSIWLAQGDSAGQKLLIKDGHVPAWSPDRAQIAFMRKGNLWVAEADGTGQRRVTKRWKDDADLDVYGYDASASWDPCHPRLTFSRPEVFSVSPADRDANMLISACSIYDVLLNTKDLQLRCLFDPGEDHARFSWSWQSCPAWSPSGEYLAFARNGDVWVARREIGAGERAAGSRPDMPWAWEWIPTRLWASAQYDGGTFYGSHWGKGVSRLSWSPDGMRLAYSLRRSGGSGINELWVLDLAHDDDGLVQLKVTQARALGDGREPCFSPDGKLLVYDGGEGLYTLPAEGGEGKLLVADAEEPCW